MKMTWPLDFGFMQGLWLINKLFAYFEFRVQDWLEISKEWSL